MKRQTNQEYAKKNLDFISCCMMANVHPTKRQASKFRNRKGMAFKVKPKEMVWYVGKRCYYNRTFNEKDNPNWNNETQAIIDSQRDRGKEACCIHKGDLHHLYIEKAQEQS